MPTIVHDDLTVREQERLQQLIKDDQRWFWEAIGESPSRDTLVRYVMSPDEYTHSGVGYLLRSIIADYCKPELDRIREEERSEAAAELADHKYRRAS